MNPMVHRPTRWNDFAALTMVGFLERFTLHDSWIKEIVSDSSGQVTLTIGFDLHLNNAVPRGYNTLFLHVDRVYSLLSIQGAWSQPSISGAQSEVLDGLERDGLLDSADFDLRAYPGTRDHFPHPAFDDTLTRTIVSLVNWGRIELLHGASVRGVVVNEAGR